VRFEHSGYNLTGAKGQLARRRAWTAGLAYTSVITGYSNL
jgi:hypothetical protein